MSRTALKTIKYFLAIFRFNTFVSSKHSYDYLPIWNKNLHNRGWSAKASLAGLFWGRAGLITEMCDHKEYANCRVISLVDKTACFVIFAVAELGFDNHFENGCETLIPGAAR